MPYKIAGIEVHKKKLAVVVSDVSTQEEYQIRATLVLEPLRVVASIGRMANRAIGRGSSTCSASAASQPITTWN